MTDLKTLAERIEGGDDLRNIGYGIMAFAALLLGLGLAQRQTIVVTPPVAEIVQTTLPEPEPVDKHSLSALFAPVVESTCTPVAFRSDMRSSCAMGSGFNTCGTCLESFERACQSDGLGVAMREGETLDQCALRLITDRNECNTSDLVPDGTEGYGIEISKYDGKTYYRRDCYWRRHTAAMPKRDDWRGDCWDTNEAKSEEGVEACVDDMERQWKEGNDFPEKNRDILSGRKP